MTREAVEKFVREHPKVREFLKWQEERYIKREVDLLMASTVPALLQKERASK